MSPITREFLSESTDGADINITTSGSPGTLIHTATSTVGEKDEVWLWGVNNSVSLASVAIEWAGIDDNLNRHLVGIPSAEGDQLLIAGKTLAGGLPIRVYSTHPSASVSGVNIGGHVNRIS